MQGGGKVRPTRPTARGVASLIASRCGEGDLDAGNGHAAFADSGRATFHRAGTGHRPRQKRAEGWSREGPVDAHSLSNRRIGYVGSRFEYYSASLCSNQARCHNLRRDLFHAESPLQPGPGRTSEASARSYSGPAQTRERSGECRRWFARAVPQFSRAPFVSRECYRTGTNLLQLFALPDSRGATRGRH
jgi:hypothetical protein